MTQHQVAKIEQLGICKSCSFGDRKEIKCKYHELRSLNYRGVPDGLCALDNWEIMSLGRQVGLRVSILQELVAENIQPLSDRQAERT
jgi:hypothetical protein